MAFDDELKFETALVDLLRTECGWEKEIIKYPTEEDLNFNKWRVEKTDEQILQEALADRNAKWCKFPSLEAIEQMESRHKMMVPDHGLIKEFFRLFGKHLAVDERMFTKGARLRDESSSDISGTDVR